MAKKIFFLTVLVLFFGGFFNFNIFAEEKKESKIIESYVTLIDVVSGEFVVSTEGLKNTNYKVVNTIPFSYSKDGFKFGDQRTTVTRVKYIQTKEMESKNEILVDTTEAGYSIEFVVVIDPRTRQVVKRTGMIGVHGCTEEYHGRINYGNGFIIESLEGDPLVFETDRNIGFVYKKGSGVLKFPDGKSFTFPPLKKINDKKEK
ncbi:MAG: hypothetical protein HY742_06160 [Deltaproteobacteria bacterium]|nr:hypothetical protein [Deltaproteobacteria bacterium]